MQVKSDPARQDRTPAPSQSGPYLDGLGSALDIFVTVAPEAHSPVRGVPGGIAGDWQRVGQDLVAAFEKGDPTRRR